MIDSPLAPPNWLRLFGSTYTLRSPRSADNPERGDRVLASMAGDKRWKKKKDCK